MPIRKFTAITSSGIYTPTLFNVANLESSLAYKCQWSKVGQTIIVSGKVDVNPLLTANTQLGISLPISSNFANAQDCAGTAFAATIAGEGAGIMADTINNRAQLQFIATDVSNQSMFFIFSYEVI